MIEIIILIGVITILVLTAITGYLSWFGIGCPVPIIQAPVCPPCPVSDTIETENLKDMVRYLTLVIKKYEAEKELYLLSNGYHQVYNSPKMEYLKKEISRTIDRIKNDPNKSVYFEQNLSNIV